jgi:hypothetical protein
MEYRVLLVCSQNPLLSLMSPVYTLSTYVCKARFNIILTSITEYSM